MDDALVMCVVEGFCYLGGDARGHRRIEAAVAVEASTQGIAVDELHREVRRGPDLASVEDADDIGVMEGAPKVGFSQEALDKRSIVQKTGEGTLESESLAAPLRFVDTGHASLADASNQPIVAEFDGEALVGPFVSGAGQRGRRSGTVRLRGCSGQTSEPEEEHGGHDEAEGDADCWPARQRPSSFGWLGGYRSWSERRAERQHGVKHERLAGEVDLPHQVVAAF